MQPLQEKYKYNPFIKYGKELESIISEKAYSENIASMLRLSFPIMIEYYGHEYKDILFHTLKEITIEMPQDETNMYDIVQKYTPSNIEKRAQIGAVKEGELKRASGVHFSNPHFEIVNGKPVLSGKSEVIAIKGNSSSLNTLATFVHELSHAFKSNQNGVKLFQDKDGNQILVTRSGLSVIYSKVSVEDKTIILEDIKEQNIGLEEGINAYDENHIMNQILSKPISEIPNSCQKLRNSLTLPDSKSKYASSGYVQETVCANKLLTKCNLESFIRQDQFFGTNHCEQKYNSLTNNPQNTWHNLNAKLDISVRHTYARYENMLNPKWYEEHQSEIIRNLREIHSMLDECATREANKNLMI